MCVGISLAGLCLAITARDSKEILKKGWSIVGRYYLCGPPLKKGVKKVLVIG